VSPRPYIPRDPNLPPPGTPTSQSDAAINAAHAQMKNEPANSPKRDREGEMCEAAYRCVNPECLRPWVVFAVHGEPTDGIDDPRVCRFCGADGARRVR
jgi:hypothetical protein